MSSSSTGLNLSGKVGTRSVAANTTQPVSATSDAEDRAGQHSAETVESREGTNSGVIEVMLVDQRSSVTGE
jgi:hypothetical protein